MLHENLREWAEDAFASEAARDHYGENDGRPDAMARIFRKMADEIERDYIPKDDHEKAINAMVEAQSGVNEPGYRSAHYVMQAYAKYKGMPFENGDCITDWLNRWFIKRPLYENGEPVRLGDTVWPTESPGMQMTAESLHCLYGQGMTVNCAFEGQTYTFNARNLTNREPDSLERIRDDLMAAHESWDGDPNKLVDYADRLTALMERCA